jgi:AcrR family transcriptional regulator
MAEPSEAPRSGRKAETHRRLLQAARRLFIERGYHATRPQDIARAAGVAIGTFYLHFADKWEIFVAFSEEAREELQATLREKAAGATGFDLQLRAALEAIFDYGAQNPGVLRVAMMDREVIGPDAREGQSLRDYLAEVLATSLEAGMDEGQLRDDYDPMLLAHAIVGMFHQASFYWSAQRGDRAALLDNLVTFCARALLPPKP